MEWIGDNYDLEHPEDAAVDRVLDRVTDLTDGLLNGVLAEQPPEVIRAVAVTMLRCTHADDCDCENCLMFGDLLDEISELVLELVRDKTDA